MRIHKSLFKFSHVSARTGNSKRKYATLKEANAAKEDMELKTKATFIAYKCSVCKKFHIGSN